MSKIKEKRKNFLHDLGLRWRIFIYLLGFAMIMLLLLWLFQIVYLEKFYEEIKKDQINIAYERIVRNLGNKDFEQTVTDIAVSYNICADIFELNTSWFFEARRIATAQVLGDCIIHIVPTLEIIRYYNEAIIHSPQAFLETYSREDYSNVLYDRFFLLPRDTEMKGLVYSRIATDEQGKSYLVLLNSTITPISATVATLQVQLMVISLITLGLALVISFMIARRLSRPISQLNSTAKVLAKGDFSGTFPAGGYREISELADTLNYAASELARIDTLQKDIIANISHDIRTPLTMISGYAEVMRDFPEDSHSESIEVIIRESNRLRDLVSDILDSSRIKAGASSINPQLFNFTAALSEFIDTYNHLIEPQNYRIELQMTEEVWLNADRQRLLQAIGNMLNNSLTHIGSDKLITVRQIVQGRTMRLEIADRGCGIAPEDIPHLWERYYRTDAPARGHGGSGLGLSIVKGIMEMHGAKYGVDSQLGKGSTFWFELEMTALPGSKWRMLLSKRKDTPTKHLPDKKDATKKAAKDKLRSKSSDSGQQPDNKREESQLKGKQSEKRQSPPQPHDER
jgi:signal transduction histidine kinase